MKYTQGHDDTDPPDPRNLVHFIRNISKTNHHMEIILKELKQKRFCFCFTFQVVN